MYYKSAILFTDMLLGSFMLQATALIYFKRFYLQWSVMEHDPKHIMYDFFLEISFICWSLQTFLLFIVFLLIWILLCRLTCIYTACKIEENHVSAEELGKGISQDHQMILNYEMLVLQVYYGSSIFVNFCFLVLLFFVL